MDDIILKSGDKAGIKDEVSSPAIAPKSDVVDKPSFDDNAEIEIEDGVKTTLKELKSGYLRQSDYTKKTQGLAEQRKELDTFKGWVDNPDMTAFEKVKFIAEQFGVSITEAKAIKEGVEDDDFSDLDPDNPQEKRAIEAIKDRKKMWKKLASIETNLGQRDTTNAKREVENEVFAVKEKYKNIDDEELRDIISIAQANKGENLKKVADRYFGRLEKRDSMKLKTYLESKESDGKKIPLVGGGIPPSGENKKLSLEDGSAKKSLIQSLTAGNKAINE